MKSGYWCLVLLACALVRNSATEESCGCSSTVGAAPSAATQEMIEFLREITASVGDRGGAFEVLKDVEYMQRLLGLVPESQRNEVLHALANRLLEAGRTEACIEICRSLMATPLDATFAAKVAFLHSVARLRQGEQANCILNHSPDSCLLPIAGKGVHVDVEGSTQAINSIDRFLSLFPGTLADLLTYLKSVAQQTLQIPEEEQVLPLFKSDEEAAELVARFPDVAAGLGLASRSTSGGAIMDDFNNDGLLDIITGGHLLNEELQVFLQEEGGTFRDVTATCGIAGLASGLTIAQTDYDNDGCLDFFVVRGTWRIGTDVVRHGVQPNSLVRGHCDGTFEDVSVAAGIDRNVRKVTSTAQWADINSDGWIDLILANQNNYPDLYIAQGDGTFKECSSEAGLRIDGQTNNFHNSVAVLDINQDGALDVIVDTLFGDGRGRVFIQAYDAHWAVGRVPLFAPAAPLPEHPTFPLIVLDYDNDGYDDLIRVPFFYNCAGAMAIELAGGDVAAYPGFASAQLLHANGKGGFEDRTESSGFEGKTLPGMGHNIGDIDNDGFLDLYVGTGEPSFHSIVPNRMFLNMKGQRFADVSVATGTSMLQKGHGVAMGDIDNDGDLDIYAQLGGAYVGDMFFNALYLNPGTEAAPHARTHRWITLLLVGLGEGHTNRAAIGSRLHIRVLLLSGDVQDIYRRVPTTGNFGANSLQEEVGLGAAAELLEVTVTWADADHTRVSYTSLEMDSFYRIMEGDDSPVKLHRHASELQVKTGGGCPHHGHS